MDVGPDWLVLRLRRWADACTVGDGSGYAVINTLHPSWSPPTAGRTPNMKVAQGGGDVKATHEAIRALSIKASTALAAHYCWPGSDEEKARRLEVAATTYRDRVHAAHRQLAEELAH